MIETKSTRQETIKERMLHFITTLGIDVKRFEVNVRLSNGFVSHIGDSIRKKSLDKIKNAYPHLNTTWLQSGEGNMLIDNKSNTLNEQEVPYVKTAVNYPTTENDLLESNAILLGEAAPPGQESKLTPLGNNKYGLTVRLVPVRAYGGYLDNWGDPEFHETLDKHTVTVVGNHHGYYLAFAVKGKSMENWTSEEMSKASIPEDWIVTGRDIPRHHWRNKLHLHRWLFYIIVHKEGIIVKQVIEHNFEEGWIICHSLNPDQKTYPDRKIMLDDCYQILNVVQKGVAL